MNTCKECIHAEMCKWVDELEGRGCDFGEPCEDAISRADAQTEIMMSKSLVSFDRDIWIKTKDAVQIIRELPPVTPSRHKAHWLRITTVNPKEFCNRCSECGYEQFYAERYKFCPNCGAKMVEPQESEDKG